MRYTEFKNIEPEVGDILALEFGDTLIETVINEVREDGVVIELDHTAVKIIQEAIFPASALVSLAQQPKVTPDSNRRPDLKLVTPDYQQEPKSEPDRVDLQPDKFSGLSTGNQKQTENAFRWCMKYLKSLSSDMIDELATLKNDELIKFLQNRATEVRNSKKFNFDSKDIKSSQELISDFYKDFNINKWEDVVEKFRKSVIRVDEAEYQGRKVKLGKPMKGDVKKSKVYVKGPKGNVVKVNFGDPNMKIKKSNPKRRKSFRARHNCDNPGPRWKARYWSCRAW